MSGASSELARLRQLLHETEALANAGNLAAAEAKCQAASGEMKRLGQLCRTRPELQAEAGPLFARLKATVERLKRQQQRSSKASRQSSRTADDAEASTGLLDDNPFSERNVLQSFKTQEERELEHMKSREAAMDHVAQQMIDLEAIFGKLNEMVLEQGEQLQIIEDQVIKVEEEVVSGEAQLADAVVKQRSSRKKKIIIICVVVAAVLLLTLILYLVLSKVL